MIRRGEFAATLLIVATVHVAIILLIGRIPGMPLESTMEIVSTMIVIDSIGRATTRQPTQPRRNVPRVAKRSNAVIERKDVSLPITSQGVDWHAEGASAAADVVARQAIEVMRHPVSRHNERVEVEPGLTRHDPIFSPQEHVRGETQRFDDGELVTWIDDRCYATNKDFGEQRFNANTVVVVCKGNVGTPPARRDMFDHLKPNYLRASETSLVPKKPPDSSVK